MPKKAKQSMRQKTKMAGAKPKMACGGKVQKMQSGGVVKNFKKGLKDSLKDIKKKVTSAAKAGAKTSAGSALKSKAKKKMQSGGRIPPVAKGVGDIEYARRKQKEREKAAYDKSRGIKYLSTPKTRSEQARVRNGMKQVRGADGIWRNVGRVKKN